MEGKADDCRENDRMLPGGMEYKDRRRGKEEKRRRRRGEGEGEEEEGREMEGGTAGRAYLR